MRKFDKRMLGQVVRAALNMVGVSATVSSLRTVTVPKRTYQNELVEIRRHGVMIDNYLIALANDGKFRTFHFVNDQWHIRAPSPLHLRPAIADILNGIMWDRLKTNEPTYNPYYEPKRRLRPTAPGDGHRVH